MRRSVLGAGTMHRPGYGTDDVGEIAFLGNG